MRPRIPMLSMQKSGVPLERANALCKITIIISNIKPQASLFNPQNATLAGRDTSTLHI